MSNHILDVLNARRRKVPRAKTPEITESNDIPMEDLAIPDEDHIEQVHRYFHTDEGTVYPKWKKSRLPDYRPGPVKIYTKAEIEEYENDRRTDI